MFEGPEDKTHATANAQPALWRRALRRLGFWRSRRGSTHTGRRPTSPDIARRYSALCAADLLLSKTRRVSCACAARQCRRLSGGRRRDGRHSRPRLWGSGEDRDTKRRADLYLTGAYPPRPPTTTAAVKSSSQAPSQRSSARSNSPSASGHRFCPSLCFHCALMPAAEGDGGSAEGRHHSSPHATACLECRSGGGYRAGRDPISLRRPSDRDRSLARTA